MYDKIGIKIKRLAQILFWLQAVAYALAGIILADGTDGISVVASLVLILVAWVSTWLLYGFGEIIDKLTSVSEKATFIDYKLNTLIAKTKGITANHTDAIENNRRNELKNLLVLGLITEEEYLKALLESKEQSGDQSHDC